jgi:hypothetical protein
MGRFGIGTQARGLRTVSVSSHLASLLLSLQTLAMDRNFTFLASSSSDVGLLSTLERFTGTFHWHVEPETLDRSPRLSQNASSFSVRTDNCSKNGRSRGVVRSIDTSIHEGMRSFRIVGVLHAFSIVHRHLRGLQMPRKLRSVDKMALLRSEARSDKCFMSFDCWSVSATLR